MSVYSHISLPCLFANTFDASLLKFLTNFFSQTILYDSMPYSKKDKKELNSITKISYFYGSNRIFNKIILLTVTSHWHDVQKFLAPILN